MGPQIVFVPSAFKHAASEENIRWVLLNPLADGIIEEDDETKYLSIGFDKAGNYVQLHRRANYKSISCNELPETIL